MIKNKRGSALNWILIIMIILAVGLGVYFVLTSGNGSSIISHGSSIPQPPALPSG